MFNKKGGVAAEEVGGILMFMIGLVISFLLFFACTTSKIEEEYEHLEFSKDEIEAIKSLNFFLDVDVDEERKVYDVIKEVYSSGNYEFFNELAIGYFNQRPYDYWELTITSIEPIEPLYNSIEYNFDSGKLCDSGGSSDIYISFLDDGPPTPPSPPPPPGPAPTPTPTPAPTPPPPPTPGYIAKVEVTLFVSTKCND